jgi:hypothetical protein
MKHYKLRLVSMLVITRFIARESTTAYIFGFCDVEMCSWYIGSACIFYLWDQGRPFKIILSRWLC